jgi:hypothetical protein
MGVGRRSCTTLKGRTTVAMTSGVEGEGDERARAVVVRPVAVASHGQAILISQFLVRPVITNPLHPSQFAFHSLVKGSVSGPQVTFLRFG